MDSIFSTLKVALWLCHTTSLQRTYLGCLLASASIGGTICAERTALVKAAVRLRTLIVGSASGNDLNVS